MNDARAIKSILTSTLGVPDSTNIVLLLNEEATREAIIRNFYRHLINNQDIRRGDPILFFYAGHGSRVRAPEGWEGADGYIETICPYDERMTNEKDQHIHGIPDRTFTSLLHKLANQKGNNIVSNSITSRFRL